MEHPYRQAIKKVVTLIFAITFSASLSFEANSRTKASDINQKVVLVFGDSLSAGYGIAQTASWPSLLQQKLSKLALPYKVVNKSISGETTHGGLTRFSVTLAQTQPNIVIIELGANDALRSLSMHNMKNNLQSMITQAKNIGAKVLLLGLRMPPTFGKPFLPAFGQSFAELSHDNNVPLVPFMMQGVSDNAALMQADWLHPNALGQPVILANIWPSLKPLLD